MDNEKKSLIYMYVKKNNNKELIKKIFDRWYLS